MEKLKSYAKVNLGLWIVSKRADGYHNIFSYVHKVSLYDEITISPYIKLNVKTSNPSVPENEGNIVYKAVREFENLTGLNASFNIYIQKNIPVGGGLGGGSSNVATVLKYINEYFNNPLSKDELISLASYIGSDVPLFFEEGLLQVEGKGEIVKKTGAKLKDNLIIIYPNIEVNTGDIYSKVDFSMLTKEEELPIIDNLSGDIKSLLKVSKNTLGNIVKNIYPVIREVENTLKYLGYEPFITGSGSCVCALGVANEELEKICKAKNWKLYKVRFL